MPPDFARIVEGIDWRRVPDWRPPARNDSVRFSDLRECTLADLDLAGADFIGCRLNGASFARSNLTRVRFIGCYAAEDLPPADVRGTVQNDTKVINSHLHALHDSSDGHAWRWPPQTAAAVKGTLLERPDQRYRACQEIAALGDQRAALVLACLLADPHWEVRSAALDALGSLHRGKFEDANDELLSWMFQRLGDEHSLVRLRARRLVEQIQPPADLLRRSLRFTAEQPLARLEALRAATELARTSRPFSDLVDRGQVDALLTDPAPAIRADALHLLAVLDDNRLPIWLRAFADRDPDVRVKALEAVRLLSDPPAAEAVVPLLRDPSSAVRLEALYALGQIGTFNKEDVAEALNDPDPEVQRAARQLLG